MVLAKKTLMVFLLMLMAVRGGSMAAVYKVGDSAGWTNTGHVDYKTWSATKNFHVGDTIIFMYNNKFHNVIRVTHENFNACNATAPYASFTTGNDAFTLRKDGHFYFICSLPGHCEAGQKVDIRVPHPAGSNSPSPLPQPPSYTPNQAPDHMQSSVVPLPSPSLNPVPSHSPSLGPSHSRHQPSPLSSPSLSPSVMSMPASNSPTPSTPASSPSPPPYRSTPYLPSPHSVPAPQLPLSTPPTGVPATMAPSMSPSSSPAYPVSLPPSLSPSPFSQTNVPAPHNSALPRLLSITIKLWSSVLALAHFVFLL